MSGVCVLSTKDMTGNKTKGVPSVMEFTFKQRTQKTEQQIQNNIIDNNKCCGEKYGKGMESEVKERKLSLFER